VVEAVEVVEVGEVTRGFVEVECGKGWAARGRKVSGRTRKGRKGAYMITTRFSSFPRYSRFSIAMNWFAVKGRA
jgi:hypothetical protein